MESKKLKFGTILIFGINCLVGAGIFLTPGRAYASLGLNLFWLLAVCAVLAIIMALCFAEMAGRFTRTGGVYVYVSEAWGPFLGFNIGFMRFIAACVALAVQMVSLPSMLGDIWPVFHNPTVAILTSVIFMCLLAGINLISVKVYAVFTNFTGYLVIGSLIFCIVTSIWFVHMSNFATPPTSLVPPLSGGAVSAGFLLLFYAFVGFENIGVAAQDMENPRRDVPRVIITALIAVTAIYFLLFFVCVGVMGPAIATQSNSVAATVSSFMGNWGRVIIFIASIIALSGIGLSMTFAGPRNLVPLAVDNFLPASAGANNKRGVPGSAIIVMVIVTAIFIILANVLSKDSFTLLVKVATIARLIQYIAVCAGTFRIRQKGIPGTYIMPMAKMLISIAILVCLYLFFQVPSSTWYFVLALFVVSLVVYYGYSKPRAARYAKAK